METVSLLEMRENYKMYVPFMPSVLFLTFYERTGAKSDCEKALTALKIRMVDIMKANPWLGGTFVSKDEKLVDLVIDHPSIKPDDFIQEAVDDDFFKLDKYLEICAALKAYDIKTGDMAVVDTGERLCKFGIIKSSTGDKMAMFLTVNHGLGDASTVYNLYGQLNLESKVIGMEYTRFHGYDKAMENNTSFNPSNQAEVTAAATTTIPKLIKYCTQRTDRKATAAVYAVDLEELKREKEKYCEGDEFVSTNDCLTAMMRELSPKIDNVMIPVNGRAFVSELNADTAGNYLATPNMSNADLESAKSVRQWIIKRKTPGNPWEMPTGIREETYQGMALHTNWSSFYRDVPIDGFSQTMHMPARNPFREIAGVKLVNDMYMTTFRPKKDELALLFISDNVDGVDVEKHRLIKGKLMDA